MIRSIITHAIAAYFGAGIFAASLMGSAIPALNFTGKTIIAATWPRIVYCAPAARQCGEVPEWLGDYIFTFKEPTP